MIDEARKALTRLGMKLRAFTNMGGHTDLEAKAWGVVLLDLFEVERGFTKLEDELKNLRDYVRGFEPFKTWAEEDAVTISYPPPQELLDRLVATLIDNGPLMYRAIRPEEDKVREIMARVIGPALAPPKIDKPLSQIYTGFDRAHDEGDEARLVIARRNEDGSTTILAVLEGEAAEYVAELDAVKELKDELDIRRQWNEELATLNLKWAKVLSRHKHGAGGTGK